MEFVKKCILRKRMGLALIIAICLVASLTVSLIACRTAENDPAESQTPITSTPIQEDNPPRLLGVVKIPSGHGLTAQGISHPSGLAYVLNNSGSIAVLDGPHMVDLLTWPTSERGRPEDIVIDDRSQMVYVVDKRLNEVYIISGTEIFTTVQGIGYEPKLIAIHPQTNLVYIANVLRAEGIAKSSNVAVISGTQVITWVHVGQVPQVLMINPVTQLVYVGHPVGWNGEEPHGILTVISNTQVLTTTYLGPAVHSGAITDIAINKHTGEMYLIQNYSTIIYWNGKDVKRFEASALGYSLNHIAVDEKRNLAYATSWDGPPSHVLVVQQDQLLAALPVGYDPRAVVVDETHDYVYVANRLSGSMSVIRGTEVITTVDTMGWGATYITVDEPRGYIYVSNSDSPSIAVFGFDEEANKP